MYIILLRYSILVSETEPFDQDYQVLHLKERTRYKKRLLPVLNELESLKPEFQRRVDELNNAPSGARLSQLDGSKSASFGSETSSLEWSAVNKNSYSSVDIKQTRDGCRMVPFASWVWMLSLLSRHKYAAGFVDNSYVFLFLFLLFFLLEGGSKRGREKEREGDY